MWNIMKAQNYQARKDNLTFYVFIVGMIVPILLASWDSGTGIDSLTGSMIMAGLGEMMFFIVGVVTLLLTTRICGWDQADKTMNYEVLSGHSRGEVFFGRVFVSLLWGGIGSMVLVIFPVLVCSLVNGWGISMKLGDIVIRYILLLFPVFRLICEIALLTFLLKNCYKAMLIGWLFYDMAVVGSMIYEEVTDKAMTVQLAASNITYLMAGFNARLEYMNGEDVTIYATAVEPSMAVETILVSVLVGGLCLLAGYLVFRRQDIH